MKQVKRVLLASLMLLIMGMGISVQAKADDGMEVSVRIEGIHEQLYQDSVRVPDDADVEDVLKVIDEEQDSITVTLAESPYGGNYIQTVNDESESSFGGYDGWMFLINDVLSTEGISSAKIADGDNIVIFYGDPYGEEGFQFPKMDASQIEEGIVKFTSRDVTYDADGNATETLNPVAKADVLIYDQNGEEKEATYTTDKNGEIQLDREKLKSGSHVIKIEKKNSDGKPLLLRSDFTIEIEKENTDNSKIWLLVLAGGIVVIAAGYGIVRMKKQKLN